MVYKQQNASPEGEVQVQVYKMQTLVHLDNQSIEAWMVKSLSAARLCKLCLFT